MFLCEFNPMVIFWGYSFMRVSDSGPDSALVDKGGSQDPHLCWIFPEHLQQEYGGVLDNPSIPTVGLG